MKALWREVARLQQDRWAFRLRRIENYCIEIMEIYGNLYGKNRNYMDIYGNIYGNIWK